MGWDISKESFYHSKILPYLKFRTTYGFSGNIDPSMVAATTIFYAGTSPYSNTPLAQIRNYYNPQLKWETSRMLNFGLDFRSKNDIVTGSIEYYSKRGSNLFGSAIVDYTGGVGSQVIRNVASMKGQGFDVQLKTINLNGSFKWYTTLNFSYYQDKVTDYYLNSKQGSNFITTNTNVSISGLNGKPVYSVFAYKSAGLDPQTGDPRGYVNGQISKDYVSLTGAATQVDDLKYFGSALPTKFGSFINSIAYKNLSLDFSILFKLGYYFRRTSIDYTSLYSNWYGNSDYVQRWQAEGDELKTTIPSQIYPNNPDRDKFYNGSEVLVEKADNIRLQYITANYELNKNLLKKMPFKSIHFYLNISNLGVIWKANKLGIDPDYNNGLYSLINPKSYSLGLRANF